MSSKPRAKGRDRYKRLYNGYDTTANAPDPTVAYVNPLRKDGLFVSKLRHKLWNECSQHERQGIVDQLIAVEKHALRRERSQRKKAAKAEAAANAAAKEADATNTAGGSMEMSKVEEHFASLSTMVGTAVGAVAGLAGSLKGTNEEVTRLAKVTNEKFAKQDVRIGCLEHRQDQSERRQTVTEEALVEMRADQLIGLGAARLADTVMSKIHHAHAFGKAINFDMIASLHYHPTLTLFLEGYLERLSTNPKPRLYIFLLSQALDKDIHNALLDKHESMWLPVICAIESEVPPINYICRLANNRESQLTGAFLEFGCGNLTSSLVEMFGIFLSIATQ